MNRIGALRYSAFATGLLWMQVSCASAPGSGTPPSLRIAALPAPIVDSGAPGSYVLIDSLSLRAQVQGSASPAATGPTFITTYQGGRYHHEVVRALANDSAILQRFATRLSGVIEGGKRVLLDFQGSAPEDIGELTALTRAIGGVVRARGDSLSIVVPAQDTVAYPTLLLSRVADMLIIRLHGEHRPGTPPGPPVTPDFITRSIGMRGSLIGASRIGVEIPLYGYVWDRERDARPLTFRDAQMRVQRESGVFMRDPASQYLTATGRDGWVLWVPDARTVRSVIGEVRRRGVRTVYLAGLEGADPSILTELGTTN